MTRIRKNTQRLQQVQIVLQRLAKSKTGVQDYLLLQYSGLCARRHPVAQKAQHFFNHVTVLRLLLHAARIALHVHEADRHAKLGHRFQRAGSAERTDVVDHGSARGHSGTHHLRLAGVYGNGHCRCRSQTLNNADHTVQFCCDRYRLCARSGGLSTDINDVRTLGHHIQSVLYGRLLKRIEPAVRKRIRGHIKYPHNTGNTQIKVSRRKVELHWQNCMGRKYRP